MIVPCHFCSLPCMNVSYRGWLQPWFFLPWLLPAMIVSCHDCFLHDYSCHDCSCYDCFLPRLFPPMIVPSYDCFLKHHWLVFCFAFLRCGFASICSMQWFYRLCSLFLVSVNSCNNSSCIRLFHSIFNPWLKICLFLRTDFWSCSFIVDWYGFLICSCNILNFYRFFSQLDEKIRFYGCIQAGVGSFVIL